MRLDPGRAARRGISRRERSPSPSIRPAGRGRSGRSWSDIAGRSLLLSLLLRPPAGGPVEQLSLVVGLAVAEAIEATTGLATTIKWPNDVLVARAKVAGVLLESSGETVICGIGVNVDQVESELPAATRLPSVSLRVATGRAQDRATLLVAVLAAIEWLYETWLEERLAPLLPELERRDALRGQGRHGRRVDRGRRGIAPTVACGS